MSFLMTFPAFLVVAYTSDDAGSPLLVKRIEDGAIGVALFTEQLLAERCRTKWSNDAVLYLLKSREDLSSLIDGFEFDMKATHVSIDPHLDNNGNVAWIPLSEFRNVQTA